MPARAYDSCRFRRLGRRRRRERVFQQSQLLKERAKWRWRTRGAWVARSTNCNKSPAPGKRWIRPQETRPLQCILSPSARRTRLLFFAEAQSWVLWFNSWYWTSPTPPPEERQPEPSHFFLSLSVVLQSLGVFTLNSRPWKRIYSLITGIKGNVSQGVVRLLLRLFQASESWLRLRRVVILFSLHLFLKFLFEDFLSCYLG